jgi:hypothetical protein
MNLTNACIAMGLRTQALAMVHPKEKYYYEVLTFDMDPSKRKIFSYRTAFMDHQSILTTFIYIWLQGILNESFLSAHSSH